ncbi:MAG TPA: efflux RND transporter permease subunit [Bryobacteraceae bacterium]|nr:efflux RND transporter permease subunit [Bryobacteraceae bacterium]
MWIVRLALKRPYTFVVMALVIIILGVLAIFRMPTDIFPEINIPVASVIWSYAGVSPEEMAEIITIRCERSFTTSVNDIEHMESESLPGIAVIKIFFQPNAKIEAAVAQLAASSQSVLHSLPTGIFPPSILRYNASSVPILQLSISSETMSEQEIYDYGYNFIRTQMANVQGASFPLPFGGRPRQIMVDIDPRALYAQGLSASDVANAINAQNIILPSGTAKIGIREYNVRLNGSPEVVAAFNNLPVKQGNRATVYVRDVAHVRDGYAIQTNIVRHNGTRGSLLTVLKNGGASTLQIVQRLKQMLPRIRSTLPSQLKLTLLFDQSVFVRAAINGVLKEAVVAALLTALMILLFLGSWRSTVVVCVSIPLSILTSLAILHLLNETVNVMTLGGLALAVGILVDDATVEIENIHRNLAQGKPILLAILDGAQQIAVPAFVSTLCICIVFVPVIFLSGAARYLFTPLAMAVVLAMMASYILSRTLVPTMVKYLVGSEVERYRELEGAGRVHDQGIFWQFHHSFHRGFERMREGYRRTLDAALHHRNLTAVCFFLITVACVALYPFIGTDFFPQVDAGQIRFHVRAPAGTRVEETEQIFARVENTVRSVIPARELSDILDNIGLPYSGFNVAFSDSGTIGEFDGEILVSLKPGEHAPTGDYIRELRTRLNAQYPNLTFFFQPADIVGQTLNFGLPAPIDVQIVGPLSNASGNYEIAKQIERHLARIPGAVDVHVHQVLNVPELRLNVDRTRAEQVGLTERNVADSLLVALSSSMTTSPNYWINPQNAVDYPVAVQTPEYRMDSTEALLSTPIHAPNTRGPQLLSNVARLDRGTTASVVTHYNVQPLYDVYANVQDRDLGSVAREADRVLADFQSKLPRGSFLETRGQVETMRSSFVGLGVGLLFAIVLVYFVMVVNFQSWLDPFIILMALPGALSGILLMLFLTQTTISVPSLMGAIMSIGVATANSILLVNFANDLRRSGQNLEGARAAALEAGFTRLRPVIMTALAMIVGMVPMALGMGEGGEQNAPLGRAVIGGLLMATFATLFFVPVVYSVLRNKPPKDLDEIEIEARGI